MPLELIKRTDSDVWHLRGRIDEIPNSPYFRKSTGKTRKADAERYLGWFRDQQIEEYYRSKLPKIEQPKIEPPFLFADAIELYNPTPEFAGYLLKVMPYLEDKPVSEINSKMVRELGPKISPRSSTETWRKQIINPVRAVINHAHDLGRCQPLRIKGYSDSERERQDLLRGRQSRVEKTPGDWTWIYLFREHTDHRFGLLAQFMFETAARISQALALTPDDLNLERCTVSMPAAKGYPRTDVKLSDELAADLAKLQPRRPRRTNDPNQRRPLLLFGYASRASVYKRWKRVCDAAGIDHRMPHAAGRHGFATEMLNRQGIDPHTVAKLGRWKDVKLLFDTYGHSEDGERKILDALRTGRVQGLERVKTKILKSKEKT
ncbi:integrase/recombinase [Pannonibacter phragmitetus]|uniref:Integrase/recombinase n=1 Tax=Pannonibacter phragmitetus TaxID=121719 RepID=A0A378ZQH0_9HYPH|nr:tyrosine-type recombinase/integrase [Pannonibacter phragmitetus]SUA99213.1 integrase/recombinase [Pannonibacter phragmitetus]